MPPLPPRPNKEETKEENKSDDNLSENTRKEQQAGRDAIVVSKSRLEQEQEAGRQAVEFHRRRVAGQLTKDSEPQ